MLHWDTFIALVRLFEIDAEFSAAPCVEPESLQVHVCLSVQVHAQDSTA